ncbi:hypothetical protein O0S10_00690 [Methanocorpusculum sp. MG]|uniref:Uncharacterized protein n=1 Tax=Methanocorpusculum petauri TaxID=3002863 RepID=A0ABT4IEZ3_9EURY|nr:hypothetical protein [Methanocorpusculum petauri]MCZ0859740.1 hypothetical protein [Methanocorpusculum petauri]
MIALLQKLQHLQIVPFDVEVFRRVPVFALLRTGPQCSPRWLLRKAECSSFPVPGKAVPFLFVLYVLTEKLSEFLEVDVILAADLREELAESGDVFFGDIRGISGKFGVDHGCFPRR